MKFFFEKSVNNGRTTTTDGRQGLPILYKLTNKHKSSGELTCSSVFFFVEGYYVIPSEPFECSSVRPSACQRFVSGLNLSSF